MPRESVVAALPILTVVDVTLNTLAVADVEVISPPLTAKSPVMVVFPVTARVEASVAAPVTESVPAVVKAALELMVPSTSSVWAGVVVLIPTRLAKDPVLAINSMGLSRLTLPPVTVTPLVRFEDELIEVQAPPI